MQCDREADTSTVLKGLQELHNEKASNPWFKFAKARKPSLPRTGPSTSQRTHPSPPAEPTHRVGSLAMRQLRACCTSCIIAEPHFVPDTRATCRSIPHFCVSSQLCCYIGWSEVALLTTVLPFCFIDDSPGPKASLGYCPARGSATECYSTKAPPLKRTMLCIYTIVVLAW